MTKLNCNIPQKVLEYDDEELRTHIEIDSLAKYSSSQNAWPIWGGPPDQVLIFILFFSHNFFMLHRLYGFIQDCNGANFPF
jgi:hypothetical protein